MSVHKKLNEARVKLQSTSLNKSGKNSFAGYSYFELGDFIPAVNTLFAQIGLCGVVSFTSDIATLTITDTDDNSTIVITSPMGSASLKGCHEVQNIGAVETYQRRYLYVTALEIVEHDSLDATMQPTAAPVQKPAPKQSPAPNLQPPALSAKELASALEAINGCDDLATLQGIFGGVFKRASPEQQQTLKFSYDLQKTDLTKEN